MRTTILAASFLHLSSVNVAASPDVTASGPSPPPAAIYQLISREHYEKAHPSIPEGTPVPLEYPMRTGWSW
jgi:hypothetical protein